MNTRKRVIIKITERDVVSVWTNYTIGKVFYWSGNTIEIVYPGRLSNNGGCDLQDAIFLLNGRTFTGDVEVHVNGSNWYKHGHSNDARYNAIALHVVMTDDINSITTTSNGRNIPLINIGYLVDNIYSEPVNKTEQVKGFQCPAISDYDIYNSLTKQLNIIGMNRFRIRAGNFYKMLKIENPEQVIFHGISRCLGYEKNTAPFEILADRLRIEKLKEDKYQSKLSLIARIIGSAGMLPMQTERSGAIFSILSGNEVNEIERFWWQSEYSQILCDQDWCFFRIRPANHPVRRLIALSEILYRSRSEALVEGIVALILNTCCQKISNIEKELLLGWERIYIDSSGMKTRLLGKNKIRQIIINTVLPFMYAYGMYTGNRELRIKSKEICADFPGPEENHLLSYMKTVLIMNSRRKLNAVEQQGLIYLFNNFCRNKDCCNCLNAMKVMSVREQHPDRIFHLNYSGS